MTPFANSPATMPRVEHYFTGKKRDTESGNDYFGARYYASTMGRFMSPDWSAKEEPVSIREVGRSAGKYREIGKIGEIVEIGEIGK